MHFGHNLKKTRKLSESFAKSIFGILQHFMEFILPVRLGAKFTKLNSAKLKKPRFLQILIALWSPL